MGGLDLYSIISDLINAPATNAQQYIYYICGAIVVVLLVISTDLIYRVLRGFWPVK